MALAELVPGTVFARDFVVHALVARGGMGAVYRAEQRSTGNTIALKIMLPDLLIDAKSRERFEHEARVSSRIKSSHVVKVFAAGIDEPTQTPWLAMEFLEGQNLADYLTARGPLAPDVVLAVLRQVGHALSAAHVAGVVHCDLKPENIFIAPSQTEGVPFDVKVLDFGIARLVKEGRQSATVTTAVGSPHWLAPEQGIKGKTVSAATDVWSFGLIAFRLLTGRFYWVNANVPDEVFNVYALLGELAGNDPIVAPSERLRALGGASTLVPPGFDPWFARCVNRDIGARFATVSEAVVGLAAALATGRGVAATRVSPPSIPHGPSDPATPGIPGHPSQRSPLGGSTKLITERPTSGPVPSTFNTARKILVGAGIGVLASGAVLGAAFRISHHDQPDPVVDTARQDPLGATTAPPPTPASRPTSDLAVEPSSAQVSPGLPARLPSLSEPSRRDGNGTTTAGPTVRRPAGPTRARLPDIQGSPVAFNPATPVPGQAPALGARTASLPPEGPPSSPSSVPVPARTAASPACPPGAICASGTIHSETPGGGGLHGVDQTDPTGHMDPAAFRSVYDRYRSEIASCYSNASRGGAVSGVIVVRVRVGEDGHVRSTRVISDSAHNPALTRCVQTSVQSWRYPQPEGGEVEVDYPMRFGSTTPPVGPLPPGTGGF